MKRKTPTKQTVSQASASTVERKKIERNEMISLLLRSPQKDLDAYKPVTSRALQEDPDFFSHLIAWNSKKGSIRDSQVALPVLALTNLKLDAEYVENAYAHLSRLSPRELVRACKFFRNQKLPARRRKAMNQLVHWYLKEREQNWARWEGAVVQDRASMKFLYRWSKYAGTALASQILFDRAYPEGSIFEAIAQLKNMEPEQAAGTVAKFKIPFLILPVAMGKNLKTEAGMLALIKSMTATELNNNMRRLEKWGVKDSPVLRSALEEGLRKMANSHKPALKTSKAIGMVEDKNLKENLVRIQEKQLSKTMSIEGDWLILADRSGSMTHSISLSCEIAGLLSKQVRGQVHLVFFDTNAQHFDVTGKTLEEIKQMTRNIRAGGGTDISVGLQYAISRNLPFDGIAVVSDGGDNGHNVGKVYQSLVSQRGGVEPPIYFYELEGDADRLSQQLKGYPLEKFPMRNGIDYKALPNLVSTMRTNRFSMSDEILEMPLLKYSDVFTINLEKTRAKKKGNHHNHAGSIA